jgi:hypothetical protein
MAPAITLDTFLPWLAQESQKAAHSTLTGDYLTQQLWDVTLDALAWLRNLPSDERAQMLERVRQWHATGQSGTLTVPEDQRAAECLLTLLQWVVNPPPVV